MLLTTYLEHRFLLYLTMMQWPQVCTIFRAALPMTIVNLCFVSWGQSAARHQFVFQVVILYMVAGSIHTIQVIFHTSRVQVTVPSINFQTTQILLDLMENFFKKRFGLGESFNSVYLSVSWAPVLWPVEKCIGTKRSFYIRKKYILYNFPRIGFAHQLGRHDVM